MEEQGSGLKKLVESRKGVFSAIISATIVAVGLLKGVDPATIMQWLAVIGVGHSVGQGISDHAQK